MFVNPTEEAELREIKADLKSDLASGPDGKL